MAKCISTVKYSTIVLCSGADPEFLEREFICIKVRGDHFAEFNSFYLKYPMQME